jgi:cell division protein ZapD
VQILYEYPLNERVRAFLRLEDLFERLQHFVEGPGVHEHHAALTTLFEVLEVAGRGEIKTDLLQELERQRQLLASYRGNPDIDSAMLSQVFESVERSFTGLMSVPGKTGQHIRDNEWLSAIRSRAIIPGGTCEFDLPSYHAWLHRDATDRHADLIEWIAPLRPMVDALRVVLRLLRESGRGGEMVAHHGVYQQDLKGRVFQLLRVKLDTSEHAVPEISANKYVLHIRFTVAGTVPRPMTVERDVPFSMLLCNF